MRNNQEVMEQEGIISLDGITSDMPDDYFKFKLSFNFNGIHLSLVGMEDDEHQKICTIITGGVNMIAEIGDVSQRVFLELGSFEIKDEIHPYSRYNYLTHTVMEEGYHKGQFINLNIDSNLKRKKGILH